MTKLYFNSIKVRLELQGTCQRKQECLSFQFHKGTIRTRTVPAVRHLCKNFNSIKVRLELIAITNVNRTIFNFNSIKVRLEHYHRCSGCQRLYYFNSIKVRLELKPITSNRRLMLFQFHKGTIRTWSQHWKPTQRLGFQFHKGTIRTFVIACGRMPSYISIP